MRAKQLFPGDHVVGIEVGSLTVHPGAVTLSSACTGKTRLRQLSMVIATYVHVDPTIEDVETDEVLLLTEGGCLGWALASNVARVKRKGV